MLLFGRLGLSSIYISIWRRNASVLHHIFGLTASPTRSKLHIHTMATFMLHHRSLKLAPGQLRVAWTFSVTVAAGTLRVALRFNLSLNLHHNPLRIHPPVSIITTVILLQIRGSGLYVITFGQTGNSKSSNGDHWPSCTNQEHDRCSRCCQQILPLLPTN